jgi:omega-amidase
MRATVSLGQMDIALGQPEVNLEKARGFVAEAARRGSDIVVFPELWPTGYDLERAAEYAATPGTGFFARLAALAREHKIYLTGSLLVRSTGGITNSAPLFSPQGECLGQYDKIYLFPPVEEDKYLKPGRATPIFDLPWGRVALALCYDLRFPELFWRYALDGAQVIFLAAEWPRTRLAHWQTLLQARAIENQLFVAAVNCVGENKEIRYGGHSVILDPWGEVVLEGGRQEALLTAEIDLEQIDLVRERITAFADRRSGLHGSA